LPTDCKNIHAEDEKGGADLPRQRSERGKRTACPSLAFMLEAEGEKGRGKPRVPQNARKRRKKIRPEMVSIAVSHRERVSVRSWRRGNKESFAYGRGNGRHGLRLSPWPGRRRRAYILHRPLPKTRGTKRKQTLERSHKILSQQTGGFLSRGGASSIRCRRGFPYLSDVGSISKRAWQEEKEEAFSS